MNLKWVKSLGVEEGASFLDCRLYTSSCCGRAHPSVRMWVTEFDIRNKNIPSEFYDGEPGNRRMKSVETGCIAFRHPSEYPDNPGCRLSAEDRPNDCLTCVICCREESRLFVFLSCPDVCRVIKKLLYRDAGVEEYVRSCARIFAQDDELRRRSSEWAKDFRYVLDIGLIEDWL